jgi:hypothetical protein
MRLQAESTDRAKEGIFSELSVNMQCTFSEHSVDTQRLRLQAESADRAKEGTFSEHSVNIQSTFSEHAVNMQ